MSVIVKGMEKPNSCYDCRMRTDSYFCSAMPKEFCGYTNDIKRPDWCPLIELPSYGRLIDADKLLTDRMKSKYYHLPNGDIAIPIIDIEHAPTVLEQEEE